MLLVLTCRPENIGRNLPAKLLPDFLFQGHTRRGLADPGSACGIAWGIVGEMGFSGKVCPGLAFRRFFFPVIFRKIRQTGLLQEFFSCGHQALDFGFRC